MSDATNATSPEAKAPGWLNRAVWGMAATSFLSDLGHEAQSTVLPTFMGATGIASGIIALAHGFPRILAGKVFGWLGRGVHGPLRDTMLTDAIQEGARGRAFGDADRVTADLKAIESRTPR